MIHAISTNMGGAKRHLDNMVKKMSLQSPSTTFYIVLNENYTPIWASSNVKTIFYPIELSRGAKRIWFDNIEINRLIEKYDIDILISFANFGPYRAACKHILFETNALYFCDNIRHLYSKKALLISDIRKFLIKLSGTHADLIITPSNSLKEQLQNSINFPNNKIEVLYHAMDKNALGNIDTKKRKNNSTVEFIYTSHLTRHKRVEVLVKAIKILKEQGNIKKPFHITCTFDREDNASYYDELMAYIEKEQIVDNIKFIGRVNQNEMAELYHHADCMLHTTACESFGFALLEAKIFHIPIICSDIAVNKEIAKNSAIYFKTDNPLDLSQKIEYFINEKPDNFSFDDSLTDWNWDKYANRLLHIIERTLHG
ncbi:glycosyltransferase [Hydrogenimonas sp.]